MRTSRTLGIVLSAAVIALLTLSATAYKTQKGYVKTRGRYTSQGTLVPGKPLSNAVVMIRNSNSTRSDAKGNFSVTLPEQNFYLQNVKKEGYILSDPDVLKRRYSCSASPLVLVLETPQQHTTNIDWQLEAGLFLSDYLADYDKALHYYHTALDHSLKTNGEQSSSTALIYNDIGTTLGQQGRYAEGQKYLKQALKILEDIGMDKDSDMLTVLSNLGLTSYLLADYNDSYEILLKVLDLRLELLGNRHPDVARSYLNLGNEYLMFDELNDAINSYEKALEVALNSNIYEPLLIAKIQDNLGLAYGDFEMYDEAFKSLQSAFKSLQSALELKNKELDDNHPQIAVSYNNLGILMTYTEEYSKARDYFTRAARILDKPIYRNGPYMVTTLTCLSQLDSLEGNYESALSNYEKALEILSSSLPSRHPDIRSVQRRINELKSKLTPQQ